MYSDSESSSQFPEHPLRAHAKQPRRRRPPQWWLKSQHTLRTWLDVFRIRLASTNALPQLALMGLLCGILAGSIIIAFRGIAEWLQKTYMPEPDAYAELDPFFCLILPPLGGFAVGILLHFIRTSARPVGVGHVIERLIHHQGHLPWRNAVAQFCGAVICIGSGHSVGREGPSVHLGAASGSLLGQALSLPNNSIRTLVACGTAAAISASFNTPLAGVAFAMEVVMMEYSIVSFTPVILAAVIGAMISRAAYGPAPAFNMPALQLTSPTLEIPYLILMGILIGLLAILFIKLLRFFFLQSLNYSIWVRTTLAGTVTGLLAMWFPQIMGIGYSTVDSILLGELELTLMITLVFVKLFVTVFGIGLGLPAGFIGPLLVIGACVGGAMGAFGVIIMPDQISNQALYAMLGMGAMMGAVLQAPLAALTALLELTANPNIIWPGMLVIVVSNLIVAGPPFRQTSAFITLLRAKGLEFKDNPIARSLQHVGVASAMNRRFTVQPRHLEIEKAKLMLKRQPAWIIIDTEAGRYLLRAADLSRFLESLEEGENQDDDESHEETIVDLLEIPADRLQLVPINQQATLLEASSLFSDKQTEALYVVRHEKVLAPRHIRGVLTRQDVDSYYR